MKICNYNKTLEYNFADPPVHPTPASINRLLLVRMNSWWRRSKMVWLPWRLSTCLMSRILGGTVYPIGGFMSNETTCSACRWWRIGYVTPVVCFYVQIATVFWGISINYLSHRPLCNTHTHTERSSEALRSLCVYVVDLGQNSRASLALAWLRSDGLQFIHTRASCARSSVTVESIVVDVNRLRGSFSHKSLCPW